MQNVQGRTYEKSKTKSQKVRNNNPSSLTETHSNQRCARDEPPCCWSRTEVTHKPDHRAILAGSIFLPAPERPPRGWVRVVHGEPRAVASALSAVRDPRYSLQALRKVQPPTPGTNAYAFHLRYRLFALQKNIVIC